jgi:hypothetical protein
MRTQIFGWTAVALVFAAAAASPAWGQSDAKEQEKAAKDRIAEFKKEARKLKTDEEWVSAVEKLAELKHPLILKELIAMARSERREPVLDALLEAIAKYTGDESAAAALFSMLQQYGQLAKRDKDGNDVGHEMAVKILQALGTLKNRPSARKLENYYSHANLEMARQAIGAVGEIGNVESVDPLILLLKDLEAQQVPQGVPGSPPAGGPGAPPGGFPGGGTPPPNMQSGMQQESQKRKTALEPVIKESLRRITGHDEPDASKWSGWWSKNKGEMIKKQREEEKKSK